METEKLSSGIIEQTSINQKIDINKIINIYLDNLAHVGNFIKKNNDIYAIELFDFLKKHKKFNFPINKHIELFILKNIENIEILINYIVFRYKFFISGEKKIVFESPPYLLVEPVSSCNLKCPFCFQIDKTFTRKPFMGVMSFDLFKKAIDEADKIGVGAVTLASRGEPTMHKKFIEMLEYLNSKKNIFEIKINTNGTYLSDEISHAIFKNNITQIVISSDHYIKDDYERLRKGSNFEKVVKNVDRLFHIRKEFYPQSITEIRISGIDNEKNLNREKFENFWIKRSDHVTAGFPLERWDTYNNSIHTDINDSCHNLWQRMYVWYDGKVNPCDADYKSYLSYGDFNKNSLKEIWHGNIITNLRQEHLNKNRIKINPCNKCGATFKCGTILQ